MTFDPTRLVKPSILQLKPYQPGKPIAEVQQEYGLQEVIKLASNENPLGLSAHVKEAILAALPDILRYPDGSCLVLKAALAKHLKVKETQLIMGNGSEDVLRILLQAFAWGEKHLIISQYAFIAYKILAQGLGISVKEIPERDFSTDLHAMLAAITQETGMIIIANPNNPTGTYVNGSQLKAFLDKVPPHVLVICDEAYYEYVTEKDYPQTLNLQQRYPNLVTTRTFSKIYGLAGLRIGYGVAHEEVVDLLNRIRQPFNVNHLAQIATTAALEDQHFVQKGILLNEQGKKQFYEGLAELGLHYIPSATNFILVDCQQPGKNVYQALLEQGVIVRPLDPYGLDKYVRITIGTTDENNRCLLALKRIFAKEKVL
ncbi:MAG: histidinol-phosphate transaminase [Candidatus Berkiella sp.]